MEFMLIAAVCQQSYKVYNLQVCEAILENARFENFTANSAASLREDRKDCKGRYFSKANYRAPGARSLKYIQQIVELLLTHVRYQYLTEIKNPFHSMSRSSSKYLEMAQCVSVVVLFSSTK